MTDNTEQLLDLTADIVCAFVGHNSVQTSDVAGLIGDVYGALVKVAENGIKAEPAAAPMPAVAVKKSITPDHIICFEDGKKFKSMKRHLRVHYNLSPEEYREKWGLPRDYPMVAPNYSSARSGMAKKMGLGQRAA